MARFDRVIPPGKEGKVTLEVKTDNLKGKTTKGVSVITNDPHWPELKFQISAIVKTFFEISPDEHAFINIKKGDSWSSEFKIKSIDGIPFQITEVKSSSEMFIVNYRPLAPDNGEGFSIDINATSDIPVGQVNEHIKIYTDISDSIPEKIRIYGNIEGSISYYPNRIFFHPDRQDATRDISRNVHIVKKDGNELKFEGINIPHKKIKYGMIEVEKGRNYVLALIWTGKDIQKQINGSITLTTNDEEMPRINIPYSIYPVNTKR